MLLQDYTTLLQEALNGLVSTDDTKIASRSLEAEFPKWRQRAFHLAWNGSRPISPFPSGIAANKFLTAQNYIQTSLTFDANIQDDGADYRLFAGEPPVSLDQYTSGCIFCGDKLTGQTFIILKNPGEYYVDKMAGNIDPDKVYVEITGSLYKVWGNTQVETIDLNYLAANPMNIATFNPETDNYPVGEDVWPIMKAIAVYELTPPSLRPADLTKDSAPTNERMVRG